MGDSQNSELEFRIDGKTQLREISVTTHELFPKSSSGPRPKSRHSTRSAAWFGKLVKLHIEVTLCLINIGVCQGWRKGECFTQIKRWMRVRDTNCRETQTIGWCISKLWRQFVSGIVGMFNWHGRCRLHTAAPKLDRPPLEFTSISTNCLLLAAVTN